MKRWLCSAGGLLFVGLLASGVASANIIPTFVNVTGPTGGLFTFNYTVALDPAQNLISGSQLCFADVVGLSGTPVAPANWTAANRPAANCPIAAGVSVPNAAPSVLYTYSGATVLGSSNGGQNVNLGNFSFQSTNGGTAGQDAFGAVAQKAVTLTATANQGQVTGPSASVTTPEPGTLLLLGAGLVLFGTKRRFGRA